MKCTKAEKLVDRLLESRGITEAVTATKHTGRSSDWGSNYPDVYWVLKGYPFDSKTTAQLGWYEYRSSEDDSGLALLINKKVVHTSDPHLGRDLRSAEDLVKKMVLALQKEFDSYDIGDLDPTTSHDIIANVVGEFKEMR